MQTINNLKYLLFYKTKTEDEDVYGDFEDLETGELHKGGEDDSMGESEAESAADDEDRTTEAGEGGKEKTKQELRAEKKKKLKEMFNADYDDGKGI